MNIREKTNSSTKLSRVGAAAARAQKEMEDLRDAEKKRQSAYQEKLDDAKRTAASFMKRLRRAETDQRRAQEGRFAAMLGRMVLTSMKRQGLAGSLLQADELSIWKVQDLQDLKEFLAAHSADAVKDAEFETVAFDVTQLDLDLSE